jgi:hypothetical protein
VGIAAPQLKQKRAPSWLLVPHWGQNIRFSPSESYAIRVGAEHAIRVLNLSMNVSSLS